MNVCYTIKTSCTLLITIFHCMDHLKINWMQRCVYTLCVCTVPIDSECSMRAQEWEGHRIRCWKISSVAGWHPLDRVLQAAQRNIQQIVISHIMCPPLSLSLSLDSNRNDNRLSYFYTHRRFGPYVYMNVVICVQTAASAGAVLYAAPDSRTEKDAQLYGNSRKQCVRPRYHINKWAMT